MSRRMAEEIVRYLRLRGDKLSSCELPKASAREWRGALSWLDLSGLTLYFLQRLHADRALYRVPSGIGAELDDRQRENEVRVAAMREPFAAVNRGFEEARVRYAVLKGFSLVPEYCTDPSLRTQADFDYLIGESSLERAQHVLLEQGYVLKKRTGDEFSFWIPSAEATTCRQQYDPRTPWSVELHISAWDQRFLRMPGLVTERFLEKVIVKEWNSLRFYCLAPPEMFLALVLHGFKHILDGWIKASWLLEIGRFLCQHNGAAFWKDVCGLVEREPSLIEGIGIVCQLSSDIFAAPLPPIVEHWSREMRPAARVWLKTYSRDLMFEKLPRLEMSFFSPAKLVFFLQAQYLSDPKIRRATERNLLFPWRRLRSFSQAPAKLPMTTMQRAARKVRRLVFFLFYHLGANCRYWWELPRWRRLMREMSGAFEPASGSAVRSRSTAEVPTDAIG
jgi:hypothetical protein